MYRVGRLYSGDYFSKHAVINNLKRLARIAPLTNVITLEIHQQSFYESAFPIYFWERRVEDNENKILILIRNTSLLSCSAV